MAAFNCFSIAEYRWCEASTRSLLSSTCNDPMKRSFTAMKATRARTCHGWHVEVHAAGLLSENLSAFVRYCSRHHLADVPDCEWFPTRFTAFTAPKNTKK